MKALQLVSAETLIRELLSVSEKALKKRQVIINLKLHQKTDQMRTALKSIAIPTVIVEN